MEFVNSFIVFDNVGSFLLWTVVVAEFLSLAKNAILIPSDDSGQTSRTDILSWIDYAIESCLWKTYSCTEQLAKYVWHSLSHCTYLSLGHTWHYLSHAVYPFLFGEIIPEDEDVHGDHQYYGPDGDGDVGSSNQQLEEPVDVKEDHFEESGTRSHLSRKSSGEIVVHRLRSGTVYGRSPSTTRSYSDEMFVSPKHLFHPDVISEGGKEGNINVYGNNERPRNVTKYSEAILRYRRPRSLLQASLQTDTIRSLGYFARSRKAL